MLVLDCGAHSTIPALTLLHVYTTGASRISHREVFLKERALVERITGKPILLRTLSPHGTLIAMNTDMELAQIQGFCDAFVSTNNPEHTGLDMATSEDAAERGVQLRCVHIKWYEIPNG